MTGTIYIKKLLEKILKRLSVVVPEPTRITFSQLAVSGILTSSGGEIDFFIPLNRVISSNASVSSISFDIITRAGYSNGGGQYITRGNDTVAASYATFSSDSNFVFYDLDNVQKTITKDLFNISIQGDSVIRVDIPSGQSYKFSVDSTRNGYMNNQPLVIRLQNVVINFAYN